MTKALTPRGIEAVKPAAVRREIPDGLLPGLYLIVQPSGAKSFAVRYRHAGKPRKATLGAFPAIDLASARDLGGKALRAAAEGRDPAAEKQARKGAILEQERGRRDLFASIAREFVERHAMKNRSWRETARILGLKPDPENPGKLLVVEPQKGKPPTVIQQWGGRRVQDIGKRDIVAMLDVVRDRGAEIMANRHLSAVRKLFSWCVDRDVIQVSPCASIQRPAPERSRDRILTDAELRSVWIAAGVIGYPFGAIVQLLILTGQRRSEVAGMRWSELDLEARLWALPAERVKNGKAHTVPLSDLATGILKAAPHVRTTGGFVFAGRGRDAAVSGFAPAKARLDAAIEAPLPHWTLHDLRRTAATGMADIGILPHVIEAALNHISGAKAGVAGIYNRAAYLPEKKAALTAWAAHVDAVVSGERAPGNVVALRPER